MGMTRRMQHYDVAAWHPWLLVAAGGAAIILAGIILQIAQLVVSIRHREELRDTTGDPWDGRTLEWATPSPPPAFNFAVLPHVEGEDAYWGMKQRARQQARLSDEPAYTDIEMPRNSPTGFVCAFFATFMGFALIWHIWWLVAVAAFGAYATFVVFAWRDEDEYMIPADEVARIDRANRSARGEALAQTARPRHERRSGGGRRDPHRARTRRRRWTPARGGARGGGLRVEAHHRRLRLLDLPAQRHRHVLGLLRDLRGAGREHGGRAERARAVRPAQRRLSRRPACCSRASPAASPASAPRRTAGLWFYGAMAVTFMLGAAFLGSRCTSSPGWSRAAQARRAARSSRRSSPWSAATACT